MPVQPKIIRKIIFDCWSLEPSERPTIENTLNKLQRIPSDPQYLDQLDKENIKFICDYVRRRVGESNTLYRIGSRPNQL